MDDERPEDLAQVLRETQARYVVGAEGQPVAVLLTIDEYEHYLDLLDDEADCQDPELAARLEAATRRPAGKKRLSFRAYMRGRNASDDQARLVTLVGVRRRREDTYR